MAQDDQFIADNECHLLDAEDELQDSAAPLDGNGFTLTSWNIYKQQKPGWSEDLRSVTETADLVLLQEASLSPGFKSWLDNQPMHWTLNPAFHQQQGPAGVMTVSRLRAEKECAQHMLEPWLGLPKGALISYYSISGHHESVLVVNLHGVNFTLDESVLNKQLQQLGKYISEHQGPMVLAGDFNTWSEVRQQALQEFADKVGLRPIVFTDQQPAQHFGRTLDHIYVRGLKDLSSSVRVVQSSDHYPLTVKLALEKGIDD